MADSIADELNTHIVELGRDMLIMAGDNFKSWASSLNPEVVKLLLEKHRNNRNFYKKILQEELRETNPNSFRYEDAEKKMKKYNVQGKILKEIVDSL